MKKIGILGGSSIEISPETRRMVSSLIADLVKKEPFTAVMGVSTDGIMGTVKELLLENDLCLEIVGLKGETKAEANLATTKIETDSSFDRTATIYEESDVLLFLPGGINTESEFYSMLGDTMEKGEGIKPIILYNEDHGFDYDLQNLLYKQEKGLIRSGKDPFDYIQVAMTKEEVFMHLENSSKVLENGIAR